MALRRQIRVGSQWMYADEAQKALARSDCASWRTRSIAEAHGGHHQPWIRRYVFSTDHKWIGIQYGFTALCFLLLGFCLMILMRLQLGWPGQRVQRHEGPRRERARRAACCCPRPITSSARCTARSWSSSAIVPLAVGAFGNYLVPLQIGAPDMAFPKLNMASYWCYLPGGLIMLASFLVAGRHGAIRLDVVSAAVRHRHRKGRRGG